MYNERLANGNIHDATTAALLLYLNHHCFNGLYRTNKKGQFNAAWNHNHSKTSYFVDNLLEVGTWLRNNNILVRNEDFETFCRTYPKPGDFIYFDSPYFPLTDTANFTRYTADGFSLDDHKRLKSLVDDLTADNIFCLLSNNDTDFIRELYSDYLIESVEVPKNKRQRLTTKEVVITNFQHT